MLSTEQMLTTLECLILDLGYEQALYFNLDSKCPESKETEDKFKKAVKFHMILSKSCDIESDLLCQIESFVKLNPCTCCTATSICPSFTLTEQVDNTACSMYELYELFDDE